MRLVTASATEETSDDISELQKAMAAEKAPWRSVLTRVIDCILFLAERNLPLRGKNAQFGNPKNGNFLGILELIARYDVTLAEHLRKAASKKKNTGYLSWCTQNEFLDSISECVLGKIRAQIKASKYFAVELDCTPDISKQEQASVIIRYVHTDEKKKVTITESFVGFTAVKDTTGKGLTDTLTGSFCSSIERMAFRSHLTLHAGYPLKWMLLQNSKRRVRKQKRFQDDNSSTGHHEKEPERHFRCMVFNVIVDTVLQELSDRFSNLQLVSEKFKFITKMEHMTQAELEESVTRYALTTCDVSRDII
ncbi:Zinc finger MYM-type protein 1 [Collichthys lucidus]|uniref:Zinc finger MYM-type protein 1 n=1 Tax=Collichthys lucidus TaxID=240159 RepID=A0A4U5TX98_COLLU|nr:Zinc finger MYM-type protein 1 [Collichthys lucidus]